MVTTSVIAPYRQARKPIILLDPFRIRSLFLAAIIINWSSTISAETHCQGYQLLGQDICAHITNIGHGIEIVDRALVVHLLIWIQNHSTYDILLTLRDPPTVMLRQYGEVISYEGQELVIHKALLGAYDKQANIIILTTPWSDSNTYNVSTLLHELIHFVQSNAKEWDCWGKAELEAYKLQEAYLIEHNETAQFNWVKILMSSDCKRRDIHP